MNNTQVSRTLEQTARLLEYRDGFSYLVDELYQVAKQAEFLDVPLEVFNAVVKEKDKYELDQMLNYWFRNYSSETLWNLREIIVSGTSPLREQILSELSPSTVGLLNLRTLSFQLIDLLRGRFNIKNVSTLKKACVDRFLSESGVISEQEELDLLEEIVLQEELNSSKENDEQLTDQKTLDSIEGSLDDVGETHTIFWPNANALAEYILQELREPFKSTIKDAVSGIVSSETIDSAKDQVLSALGKVKRFFLPRNAPGFAHSRLEEKERIREQSLRRASPETDSSFAALSNQPLQVETVGSISRGQDTINRLDFLVRTDRPEIAFERIKKSFFVKEILREEKRFLVVSLRSNSFVMPFDNQPTPEIELFFYVASDFVYGVYEVLLTSTKGHWNELCRRASLRGYKLFPLGLYNGTQRISSRTSERLYERLGLPFIPAELREDRVEWNWIDRGMPRLISIADLQGDLHMHTTFTDGTGSIEEMVAVARELGLSYIAMTDHTKNVASVGGMNDAEILRYWDYIDNLNQKLNFEEGSFRVLKGVEVDVLENGGLDLENETLAQADWVVASIHFGKRQSKEKIHSRYMDAFMNPHVDVIAHPTGRMIGIEDAMEVDIEFLCQNAKKYGKCLELNSQPRRLDLNSNALTLAQAYGVPIVISTDAHAPEQLTYLQFGILQAYRAGLTSDDVLNTLSVEKLLEQRTAMKRKYNQ